MVTNNIMIRPLGQFKVEQRTKDGMFNATDLLRQWNNKDGVAQRKLDHYFESSKTQEFINTIMERENLHTPKLVYVKSKARADRGGGTWLHPMLFIDFAMWINPSFKYDVLKFVYDQMLKYRNDAGDAYRDLGSVISTIVPATFMPVAMSKIAEGVHYVAFNEHYPGIRNDRGTEQEQRDLHNIESKVVELVRDGFLRNYSEVIIYLRKKYCERWIPSALSVQVVQ